jgi:hypothetical protein
MLMKPPQPTGRPLNLLTLTLPLDVGLRQAEEGHVQAAAVVEVELVARVDGGFGVAGVGEVEAVGGHAADRAGLQGQRHEVLHALLGRHRGDAFGHADAQVDDRAVAELDCRAARDDLAFVQRQPAQRTTGTRTSPVKARLYCVPMVCMWFSGRPITR